MTLRYDEYGELHPGVDFWCKKHHPSEGRSRMGKHPIGLRIIAMAPRNASNDIAREVFYAKGLPRTARITEKVARKFFAAL